MSLVSRIQMASPSGRVMTTFKCERVPGLRPARIKEDEQNREEGLGLHPRNGHLISCQGDSSESAREKGEMYSPRDGTPTDSRGSKPSRTATPNSRRSGRPYSSAILSPT